MIRLDLDTRALTRATKALREADRELRDAATAAARAVAKPAEAAVRSAALSRLPSRGGLARQAAQLRLTTRDASAGERVEVTVTATHPDLDLASLDAGVVHHPTYGRRPWVRQKIRAGFFTDTVQDATARRLDAELARAGETVAAAIARQAG